VCVYNSQSLNVVDAFAQPHTAYSISKYGMSMCALGMSAEFAGIAMLHTMHDT
jgi:hypothetical protein